LDTPSYSKQFQPRRQMQFTLSKTPDSADPPTPYILAETFYCIHILGQNCLCAWVTRRDDGWGRGGTIWQLYLRGKRFQYQLDEEKNPCFGKKSLVVKLLQLLTTLTSRCFYVGSQYYISASTSHFKAISP